MTKEILTPCAEGGFVCMPREEFEKVLETAVEKGVEKAFSQDDIKEIKNLLDAWRATKSVAWQTFVRLSTTALLAAMVYGLWGRLDK
ncbi:MAG: DUF6127 family protein [Alphaproteobacteria bacterium]